jgi:NhaA family Na+:H+ antiporter
MLWLAVAGMAVLAVMNALGVRRIAVYALVGIGLWLCVLKSGVHATLAGVIAALAVPLAKDGSGEVPPLIRAEHALQSWITFGVLPLFAFMNAGVPLAGVTPATLAQSIPLGIAAGLVLGKAFGVFSAAWLAIRIGIGTMPKGAGMAQLFGTAILCGIGFTMSLFIGSLAFEDRDPAYMTQVRLGVLAGSTVSACAGYLLLRLLSRRP